MASAVKNQIEKRLKFIYKDNISDDIINKFYDLIAEYKSDKPSANKWTEKDAVLITYGDSIINNSEKPIKTLKKFLDNNLKDIISCVHILPYFPFSSDDGFSVIDYTKVNPVLGDWDDINNLNESFDLMSDLVINHISQESEWFKQFLKNEKPGKDYFITADPNEDLSAVVRPRNTPLLTPYKTSDGTKHVWCTFSADQIDLNFENPDLLYEMTKIVLLYIQNGSRIIRLDAIAFLWKVIGTNCLHLPETHEVVKLIRDITEACFPEVVILTETNVPHKENLSYFGNNDEAHMVYQFSLPPLLLHALHTENSQYLTTWAQSIEYPGDNCTFFNFTASHDGIGVRPLEGILPQDEFDLLTENMQKFGAHISTKTNSDGSKSPYEMNITYFDALKGTKDGEDYKHAERFICSQTIAMSLMGMPAFYIHSLTATPNYHEGVLQTGRARTINRKKWDEEELNQLLTSETTINIVFNELKRRLKIRQDYKVFHPSAPQNIINISDKLFVIKRKSQNDELISISNISTRPERADISNITNNDVLHDVISNIDIDIKNLNLEPYQTMWLTSK